MRRSTNHAPRDITISFRMNFFSSHGIAFNSEAVTWERERGASSIRSFSLSE